MSGGIEARFALTRGSFSLDVAISAPGRGITGLFGPSGSGKTTVLRCVAGLERAPAGSCRVNGRTWQDEEGGVFMPTHRRSLGYVFQEASLFQHLSVRRNLEFGWKRVAGEQRRIAFRDAVDLLGLTQLLERSPTTLSGGERQRVAIARALLTSPDLLLADEPLASLDDASKAEILPYLERLHDELELPFVYISHSLDEVARIADHLVVMREGRVVASGPLDELMTRIDLALAHSEDASAILMTRAVGRDEQFHLTELAFPGGRLWVPRDRYAPGTTVRVRVFAKDVSLTLAPALQSSIINVIAAVVQDVTADLPGQVLVRLDASGVRLLARVTARSAAQLRLAAGTACYAQIKGVALLT